MVFDQKGFLAWPIKAVIGFGIGFGWAAGYFGLGARTQSSWSFDSTLTVDAFIPFVEWAVWPYLFGIIAIALPAFLVRSPGLYVRTAIAYFVVISISFFWFIALPTEAASLREQSTASTAHSFTSRVIDLLYAIDPPRNLFPPLHVSLTTLSGLALSRQHPKFRPLIWIVWGAVVISVCAVKQHSVMDVVSGAVLELWAITLVDRVAYACRR